MNKFNLIKGDLVDVKMWTKFVPVESDAISQLKTITSLPFVFKHIAAMPDVHVGIGSTVGTVLATRGTVIPACVGVDIGCFTADTKVQLADGRKISFAQLLIEYNSGKQNYIYSVDNTGEIEISSISQVLETRKTSLLVKVYLDNDAIITCTPDHKFMLRDGTYVEAQHLTADLMLMPYYEKLAEASDKLILNDSKVNNVLEKYHIVYNPKISFWEYSHRLADRYNYRQGTCRVPAESASWCRHHADFDKYNNNPDNILRVGRKEHWEIHATAISENNKKGLTGWKRSWKLHGAEFAKQSSIKLTKLHKDPVFAAARDARALAQIKSMNANPSNNMKAHRKYIGELGGSRFSQKNKDENVNLFRQISKIRNAVKYQLSAGVDIYNEEEWDQNRNLEIIYNFPRWITATQCCDSANISLIDTQDDIIFEGLREKLSYKNHTVVKIEVISLPEEIPVYCLTVPEFGNFALADGIFVKNCGMIACQLSLKSKDLPDNLHRVRTEIENMIPVGFDEHTSARLSNKGHQNTSKLLNNQFTQLEKELKEIVNKHPAIDSMSRNAAEKAHKQIGTLGGGNHFIELCISETDDVWLMLHSGSRGIGNVIGRYFIELAQKEMEGQQIKLPNKDLAYLQEGSKYYDDYIQAVGWAQEYARRNRDTMLNLIITALSRFLPPFKIVDTAIQCHHNYVSQENHFGEDVIITRKGAVAAHKGVLGIIPGSMGAKSFIVRGLGNAESFCSCSHGGGRVMSRSAAKKRITLEDHIKATEGVECRKDEGMIDESPAAYKNIDDVMRSQDDLVEIVHTLKQVLCVKG